MMFRKILPVVMLLLAATNLWAAKSWDVSKTRHNLGSTATVGALFYGSDNEDEVCIFCHTPHGGTLNTPLWNRAVPAATGFTHYTSLTLSSAVGLSTRNVNAESLLCMSCHDGVTAVNSIINNSNSTVGPAPNKNAKVQNAWFSTGGAIGDIMNASGVGTQGQSKNLSDDHPISFSFYDAVALPANSGKLHIVADAKTAGLRFFGPTGAAGGDRIECSTCHDPHVNYEGSNGGDVNYTPFLVAVNTGSALCLSCHIK